MVSGKLKVTRFDIALALSEKFLGNSRDTITKESMESLPEEMEFEWVRTTISNAGEV